MTLTADQIDRAKSLRNDQRSLDKEIEVWRGKICAGFESFF